MNSFKYIIDVVKKIYKFYRLVSNFLCIKKKIDRFILVEF